MPIEYHIDTDCSLIRSRVDGVATMSDVIEYFKRLEADDRCPEGAIEIADFSKASDFTFRFTDMHYLVKAFMAVRQKRRLAGTIFYSTTALGYGISRMFSSLLELQQSPYSARAVRFEEELQRSIEKIRSSKPDTDNSK